MREKWRQHLGWSRVGENERRVYGGCHISFKFSSSIVTEKLAGVWTRGGVELKEVVFLLFLWETLEHICIFT